MPTSKTTFNEATLKSFPDFRGQKANWPIPLDEFQARRYQAGRGIRQFVGWSKMAGVALFVFVVISAVVASGPEWLDWAIGLSFVIFFLSFLFAAARFAAMSTLQYDLKCPRCGVPLINEKILIPLAINTGKCGRCSARLISDSESVKSSQRADSGR